MFLRNNIVQGDGLVGKTYLLHKHKDPSSDPQTHIKVLTLLYLMKDFTFLCLFLFKNIYEDPGSDPQIHIKSSYSPLFDKRLYISLSFTFKKYL